MGVGPAAIWRVLGEPRTGRRATSPSPILALTVLCAVLFLTFLDTTIVSVALADIQTRLHASVTQLQWVVGGYALTFASLMLLAGSLSDRFGRKRVLLLGLVVFAAGSVLCALAPNADTVIAGRVVMGVGAAASEPGTLSIIRHLFPDSAARSRALGAWAAASALALALGPVVGGGLVALGSWRAIFWFNIAATGLLFIIGRIVLPESADPAASALDSAGFVSGAVGIGALTFAVILGETASYESPTVIVLFLVGVVALAAFVRIERHTATPMLDLAYFRMARFSGSMIVAFVLFFSIFSIFFFVALYLSAVVGYSPGRVAVEFVPMAAAMIFAAGFAGRYVALSGPRLPMAEGCALASAGVLLSALLLEHNPPSLWLMATLALAGFGFGSSVVPMTSVALGAVPPARSGMAASATNTSRELGAVFGVAVLGALVNAHLTNDLTARLQTLHIPPNFISIVINAIETGTVPSGVHGGSSIEVQVIHAAYRAFQGGLEVALVTSGVALLVAAVVSAIALNGQHDDVLAPYRPSSDGAID
jgi:EmrB/QacA subfamily drug resistance transporter